MSGDAELRAQVATLQSRLIAQRRRLAAAEARVQRAEVQLDAVLNSRGWRLLDAIRRVTIIPVHHARALARQYLRPAHVQQFDPVREAEAMSSANYARFLQAEAARLDSDCTAAAQDHQTIRHGPLVSVLLPVYNTPATLLREAIESVQGQVYPRWELCISDDASTQPHVREVLEQACRDDSRIRVEWRARNGHISEATNTALAMARGEYVALFDHDDLLHPLALYRVAREIVEHPGTELVYTDEDKVDTSGRRSDPYFKSDYNPELLLSHNMVCHLGVYRRETALAIGGFRTGFEGAQDYDLALRFIERVGAAAVRHVPEVLYHWRMHAASTAADGAAKPYAQDAGRRAVLEHLGRTGARADVLPAPDAPGMHRVRYEVEDEPSVEIVIPTRDRAGLLGLALRTLFEKTAYANFTVTVVDNGSVEPETFALFEQWKAHGRFRVLRVDEPFNFSRLNNLVVAGSQADLVCLLNNDIEVTEGDWLREMVSHAVRPGVGCVGARLWYPDGRLQHGGVLLGVGGVAGHAHKYWPRHHAGYFGRAVLLQSFSAVTAACLVIRRSIYEEVGGLDETLQVAFNDVDFCLRVRERGYRNVWTPYAELVHHESVSRGTEDSPEKVARFNREIQCMQQRWGDALLCDPMYSPRLTLEHENFAVAEVLA